MTDEVERLMDEVRGSRPAGHFDQVPALLHAYCEAIAHGQRAVTRLHQLDTSDARYAAAVYELCRANAAACDLAERLHLLPGDRGAPPPRLQ